MNNSASLCSAAEEDVFGPVVHSSCLGGFDFTLLFEEGVLTILPLVIAIIWGLLRYFAIRNEGTKALDSWHLPFKLLLYAAFVGLQATLLALWLGFDVIRTRLTVSCLTLTFVGYSILAAVSYFEHTRSVRPSTVLCIYLGACTLLDLPRVRTLFFLTGGHTVAVVLLSSFLVRLLLLCLELFEKRTYLKPEFQDESPEGLGSIYNRALFLWLNRLFIKGFNVILNVNTLLPLDSLLTSASNPEKLNERWERATKSRKDALLWTFIVHYKWSLMAGVLPRVAYTGFNFAQPYLVQRVLDFVSDPKAPNANNYSYGLLGAYGIVYIGIGVSYAAYTHATYRSLTLFRGSLIALIFDKTLYTCSSSIHNAEAITLMSADIDRIGSSLPMIHETYGSCLDLALAFWLLYRFLGVAMVAPVVWTLICLMLGLPIAAAAGNAQVPWLEAIEERLSATAKALAGMKSMKMMGLADIMSDKIAKLRLSEIKASRRLRILTVLISMFHIGSSAFTPVLGFTFYILRAKANGNGTLTDNVAFAALSLFELLNQPMAFLVNGYEDVQIILNCFRRVQEYLMSEAQEDYRICHSGTNSPQRTPPLQPGVITEACDEKDDFQTPFDLDGCKVAAFVKVVSAGYGENENLVLKDLNFQILHGKTTMVIGPVGCGKSTLLKLLLGELPTVVGSVSTTFTKAAFCPQTPWTIWGTIQHNIVAFGQWNKEWYDTVVHSCALLEDFRQLAHGDQTATGSRGSCLSGGQKLRVSLARALFSRNTVMMLDDVLSGLDWATEQSLLNEIFGSGGLIKTLNSTVVMATSSARHVKYADYVLVLDEKGRITQQGTSELIFKDRNLDQGEHQPSENTPQPEPELIQYIPEEINIVEDLEQDTSRTAGDMKLYLHYSRITGWWTMAFYIIACAIFVFGTMFPSVWLQWWTNSNERQPNNNLGYWLGIYGALAVLTLAGCALSDCALHLVIRPKTAIRFHDILLNTTMRATSSALSATNSGTTLNRFSQDLELIDNDLPGAIDATLFQFFSALASTVLVFIGSGYLAAAIPACLLVLGLLQFYYLRTSRQLRLLDIEAKAPLFSHFLETLNGISSIRAYGWSQNCKDLNTAALNLSQKPYYLMWCIQRWLTLVLDMLVAGVGFLLVAIATNVRGHGSTGFLGVALFNVVTFSSTIQSLVQSWTQMETALGAINRIASYAKKVRDENLPSETDELQPDWPAHGQITFKNVSASYESSSELVLQNIDISIAAGEKVAICGRTGSGKSSLISTLYRMLNIESGTITIDGIDIGSVPRQEVRKRLNTLPQEAFFLHGTVRENIDPLNITDDELIKNALRDVGMWSWFESHNGLEETLNPEILSEGQRQLFCLARAMLQNSSILIMDESTSSIGTETDALIQQVMHKNFRTQTVVAIIHKLQTVLDYDRVILLDKGQVIEMGNPRNLLATPESALSKLYEALGEDSKGQGTVHTVST